jgi:hypothetical protein
VEPDDQRRVRALEAAAGRLSVDYESGSAIRALESAQIQCILLKGPSVARWLYEPEDARTYADTDLLVPSESFDAAVAVLARLGFEPEFEEAEMPGWWREHALTLLRISDGAACGRRRDRNRAQRGRTPASHRIAHGPTWRIVPRPGGAGESH